MPLVIVRDDVYLIHVTASCETRSKTLTFGTQRYSYKSGHVGKRANRKRGDTDLRDDINIVTRWTCVWYVLYRD
jgi:hypothetical protein